MSFDSCCKEFSRAWKKARAKASEKSIHDLRVLVRRLTATLELVEALSKDTKNRAVSDLERKFKKVHKRLGPLRDAQVQLENVSHLRQVDSIRDFTESLERRERHRRMRVRKELSGDRRERLEKNIKKVRAAFVRLHKKLGETAMQNAIQKTLKMRRDAFAKAWRHFQPAEEATLHEMRIALKKLRYVLEAAAPVLGNEGRQRAREMHVFQQLMGDTRDMEILRSELEVWARRKGISIAVAPALDKLDQKRQSLILKISDAPGLADILAPAESRPMAEKTRAVQAPAEDVAASATHG